MILESWSIALITCSAISIVFGFTGSVIAFRVVRSWDPGADSEHQIRLEQQVWLAATLTQFALVVQVISVFILIYAAAYFATILKGAMCAAGALSANGFGLPALTLKIITLFLAALWIIVHRLDIGCESYPFTRLKSIWLLVLFPFLCADAFLTVSYLLNLEPEIVTSCCGVLFGDPEEGGFSLFDYGSPSGLVWVMMVTTIIVFACSQLLLRRAVNSGWMAMAAGWMAVAGWIGIYILAIIIVTVVVSPYVYALPHHRCPFDLFHYPYAVVGLPLYLFLHTAVVLGLGWAVAGLISGRRMSADRVRPFMTIAIYLSFTSLILFFVSAAWPPFSYVMSGGQN